MPTLTKSSQNLVKRGDSTRTNKVENSKWHSMVHLCVHGNYRGFNTSLKYSPEESWGGFELQLPKSWGEAPHLQGEEGIQRCPRWGAALPDGCTSPRSDHCSLLPSAAELCLQSSQGCCDHSWVASHISDPPRKVSLSLMIAYLVIIIRYITINNLP